MNDKWHWLRHKWSKWQPYQVNYKHHIPDVRQRRHCIVCGFMEDNLVDVNALLPELQPQPEYPKVFIRELSQEPQKEAN